MTSVIHQPQDKLFKLSMAERAVAKEFFETHLPAALLKKIDLESLKLEKETFIVELTTGSSRSSTTSTPNITR